MADDIVVQVQERMSELAAFMSEVRTELLGLKDKQAKTWQLVATGGRMPAFLTGSGSIVESLGSVVAKSEQVKAFMTGSLRGAARVAVPGRVMTKAIIVTDTTLKPGAQGAPVEPLPTPPLGVLDLLPQVPLSQGTLMVVRQKTRATPGATVQVTQGSAKAEQAITFETVQVAPETLAAWVPVSRQAAQDVAGLQAFIDSELMYAVKVLEEDQVLNGTSTFAAPVAGQFTGLNTNAPAITTTSTTAIDAIADLIGALVAAGVRVTGVVLNPADALALTKLKTPHGEYVLGSPAASPNRVLWGVSWATSMKQPAGTVLAGDFSRGARLWFREDAEVTVSSEHADFFVRNLLAVRCEERVLLEIAQPSYFGKMTLPTGA